MWWWVSPRALRTMVRKLNFIPVVVKGILVKNCSQGLCVCVGVGNGTMWASGGGAGRVADGLHVVGREKPGLRTMFRSRREQLGGN